MRATFSEFYRPSDDELGRFLKEAVIIPDTNVLLDLYRLTTSEREQVLGALAAVKDHLWLPYQVGLEYQQTRLSVIRGQGRRYDALAGVHRLRSLQEMTDEVEGAQVPDEVKAEVKALLPDLANGLRSAAEGFTERVQAIAERHAVPAEQAVDDDPVRARLDALFQNRVGKIPDLKEREDRIREGNRRVDASIPPGYADAAKESPDQRAGDYLVWSEVLDRAASSDDRWVLFITSDEKEDWYARSGGRVIGPRPELVREFNEHSNGRYHQVTLADFLLLANQHLSTGVDPETIERASVLAADEVSERTSTWREALWKGLVAMAATKTRLDLASDLGLPAGSDLETIREAIRHQPTGRRAALLRRLAAISNPEDEARRARRDLDSPIERWRYARPLNDRDLSFLRDPDPRLDEIIRRFTDNDPAIQSDNTNELLSLWITHDEPVPEMVGEYPDLDPDASDVVDEDDDEPEG